MAVCYLSINYLIEFLYPLLDRGQAGGDRNEKEKKMIKFRLIILMVLCAGLLLGAWIVRGHLIHLNHFSQCAPGFQAPAEEYIFRTNNHRKVCCTAEFFYGAATSLYAAVLAILAVFIIRTAVGVLTAYMPVVLLVGY